MGLDRQCHMMPERSPPRGKGRPSSGKGLHHCTYCPYSTSVKTNIVNHMRTHTGEKPFVCQMCPYRSNQRTNLKTHMRTHTTSEKSYMCPHCSFSYKNKANLVTHIWTCHQTILWTSLPWFALEYNLFQWDHFTFSSKTVLIDFSSSNMKGYCKTSKKNK